MIAVATFDLLKTADWPSFSSMSAAMTYIENNSGIFEANEIIFLLNFTTGEHKRIICRNIRIFEEN